MGFQAGGGRIGASTSPTSTTGGFQAGGHVRTASSTTSGSTAGPTRTQTAPPPINVGTTYTESQSVSVGAVQPTTRPSFAYRGSFGSYGHTATTPSLRAGPTSVWFTQFGYTAKTYPFPPFPGFSSSHVHTGAEPGEPPVDALHGQRAGASGDLAAAPGPTGPDRPVRCE